MTLYSSAMPTKKKSDAKNATRGAEDLGKVLGVLDKLWKERVPSLLLRPGNAGGASALATPAGTSGIGGGPDRRPRGGHLCL